MMMVLLKSLEFWTEVSCFIVAFIKVIDVQYVPFQFFKIWYMWGILIGDSPLIAFMYSYSVREVKVSVRASLVF